MLRLKDAFEEQSVANDKLSNDHDRAVWVVPVFCFHENTLCLCSTLHSFFWIGKDCSLFLFVRRQSIVSVYRWPTMVSSHSILLFLLLLFDLSLASIFEQYESLKYDFPFGISLNRTANVNPTVNYEFCKETVRFLYL